MKEKWVQICQIQGFEEIKDCYWISNSDEDKVINRNTGKMKKNWIDKKGYPSVCLRTIDGKYKMCRIHVLKAKAFIYTPNPLGYNIVRHLNDVKTDNRLINLAWGSQSDNIYDCIRNGSFNYKSAAKNGKKTGAKNGKKGAKKTSKAVRCLETGIIYPSAYEAERQTGIDRAGISNCCRGERKTTGGLHFEFVDSDE